MYIDRSCVNDLRLTLQVRGEFREYERHPLRIGNVYNSNWNIIIWVFMQFVGWRKGWMLTEI